MSDNPPPLRRSTRPTRTSSLLQDFHIEATLPSRTVSSSSPTEVSGTAHSIFHVLSYDRLSPAHRAFIAALTMHREPTSFSQAVLDPKWRKAMQDEICALHTNRTWSLVPLPANHY